MSVGSPEVVGLLEDYLELAKTQKWGSVAIAMTGHPGVAAADFAGDISLERSTLEALGLLHDRVGQSIACWLRPPQDPGLDASFVCYNVANGPLGFDFLVWLVDAEMTRIREGAPAPLKVAFWLGRDPARMMNDRRRMWLDNVFRPALAFVGAIEDDRALHGHCKEVFVARNIVAAARAREKVPRLRPRIRIAPHGAVTITLREASYGITRNSNLDAWQAWAKKHCAEDVIFVRDTAKADEPLPGFRTDPRASRDLDYRLALYEGATANLFVSNGPSALAWFGSKPYLLFVAPTAEHSDEAWNSPEMFARFHGIKFGEQWPWSRPDQRIVWKADSYENIVAACSETLAAIAA